MDCASPAVLLVVLRCLAELLGRSVILGDTATTKHPAVGFMMAIGSFLLPAALVLSVTLTVNRTGNFASRLLVGLCKRPSAHC